ncbi:hypothetical protein [Kocuria sabuli]|uniref:hypothetical protein n=1 Tax=Kocuria sabuli TaxID=3071448 RepID=UPI0034D5FA04
MSGADRDEDRGPGLMWLAAQTGRSPEDLTASPGAAVSALGEALREISALAARLESPDPEVRAAAQAEADELRAQMEAAPSPGETFGKRVADALRETTERLQNKPQMPPSTPTN